MSAPFPSALPTPSRGRPPTAGLRQRILDAAERVFTRRDYHEVLMDDVARDCGVAKGTLYRYFPSKRALCLAVMFDGIERLRDTVESAVEGPRPAIGKIERIVRDILEYAWERRFFLALMHRNEYKPDDPDSREWERRRAEISRLVQRVLEEAIAAGQMRGVEPRIAAEMLLGMLRGVNRYRGTNDGLDDLAAAVVDVFVRGVGNSNGHALTAGTRHGRVRENHPRRRWK